MSLIDQQREALVLANGVRMARADLRRKVQSGETTLIELLTDPPELIQTCPLAKVMRWQPGLAERRIIRLCHNVISPTVSVGNVGEMTRAKLIGRLEMREYKLRNSAGRAGKSKSSATR